ncbi:MAG: cyclophilin-like fold protein [Pseudomonadota bacterium]
MNKKRSIKITAGRISIRAELTNTKTADAIWNALPIEADCSRWGEEIYFEIPVTSELDDSARDIVNIGDLGFWPPGNAFCIFFGPTPISNGDTIRPASAVNIVGRINGDPKVFAEVSSGVQVRIEREDH